MKLDALETLKTLVRFQSVSADSAYRKGLQEAVDYLVHTLGTIGFTAEVIQTPKHPIILAERLVKADAPTVIIYGHYDVQPVDPISLWESEPFEPEIKGDRIYGRGAADNKGPVSIMLAAVSKLYEEDPERLLNIKFLFEGEEEIGSPSFGAVLEGNKDRLKADFVLACDSGSLTNDQIVITAGLRGITCFEVKAKGPVKDLHSGVYGGAVLNPLKALIDLCHSLHNPDGTINIPGFSDAVLPVENWEREELKKLDLKSDDLKDFLGVPALFKQPNMTPHEAIRFAPTVEFNGFWGGYQGEGSKTVIPKEASVKISCRLVADQDPQEIQDRVINTFKERCPAGVSLEFIRDHDGKPYLVVPPGRPNTAPDLNPVLAKAFQLTEELSESEFGKKSCYLREGGSIPIIKDIKDILGLDSLLIGLYLPEDGMHAPNESFSLEMLEKGQTLIEKLLAGLEK
jgi:acetylornithine deacetylase/succinyl-diaminopimelate desuccinylase-like protein